MFMQWQYRAQKNQCTYKGFELKKAFDYNVKFLPATKPGIPEARGPKWVRFVMPLKCKETWLNMPLQYKES